MVDHFRRDYENGYLATRYGQGRLIPNSSIVQATAHFEQGVSTKLASSHHAGNRLVFEKLFNPYVIACLYVSPLNLPVLMLQLNRKYFAESDGSKWELSQMRLAQPSSNTHFHQSESTGLFPFPFGYNANIFEGIQTPVTASFIQIKINQTIGSMFTLLPHQRLNVSCIDRNTV